MYEFNVQDITFYPDNSLVMIAGPYVIESENHCLFMAEKIKSISEKLGV